MATLRGSREGIINSVIESLKLVKSLPDHEIRKGIDGIISHLQRDMKTRKKKSNKN